MMYTFEIQETQDLIEKMLNGNASPEELWVLDKWYYAFDKLPAFTEAELEPRMTQQLGRLKEKLFPKEPKICFVIV